MDITIKEINLKAGLYLVATPIGNLGDMSIRALEVLAAADVVACEDSRVSGKLLSHFGLKKKMVVYNDHSDAAGRDQIMKRIGAGEAVALVSDAGMPMISDPGYKLVQAAYEKGVYVTSVPGANAPLAAVQLSGMPSDAFSFIGFLPHKVKARQDVLARWKVVRTTLVTFESASRLLKTLIDIEAVLGAREVAVVREITKKFEEVRRGAVSDLIAHYDAEGAPKGEIVLVIAPPDQQDYSSADLEDLLREALGEGMRVKDAAAFVAEKSGVSKSKLYEMALKIEK